MEYKPVTVWTTKLCLSSRVLDNNAFDCIGIHSPPSVNLMSLLLVTSFNISVNSLNTSIRERYFTDTQICLLSNSKVSAKSFSYRLDYRLALNLKPELGDEQKSTEKLSMV